MTSLISYLWRGILETGERDLVAHRDVNLLRQHHVVSHLVLEHRAQRVATKHNTIACEWSDTIHRVSDTARCSAARTRTTTSAADSSTLCMTQVVGTNHDTDNDSC